MFIEFGKKSLEDLYLTGSTDDKKYERLPKDIKKRYVKVVNMMRAARRIEDLFLVASGISAVKTVATQLEPS